MIKLIHLDSSRKQEVFAEFNGSIKDICFVKDCGYFFISDCCMGKIDLFGKIDYPIVGKPGVSVFTKGFKQSATLEDPSSLCYQKNGERLFVVCKKGFRVVSLEIRNDFYCLPAFSNVIDHKIDPFNNINTKNGKTCISTDGNVTGWIASSSNRVFVVSNSGLRIIGNGKAGYSIADKEEYTSMNNPSGIVLKGETVMVSDTLNHCIRTFNGKNHSILEGHPVNSDIFPEKIMALKDALYIMDRNEIKLMFSSKTKPVTIYKASKIVSFTVGVRDQLAILVEE